MKNEEIRAKYFLNIWASGVLESDPAEHRWGPSVDGQGFEAWDGKQRVWKDSIQALALAVAESIGYDLDTFYC